MSAWGLMYSKIRFRPTLECARKLNYVRCTSRQCSKSLEAYLQAAGKQPAALRGGQLGSSVNINMEF